MRGLFFCWDCVILLWLGAGKVGPVGKSGFAGDCTSPGKAGFIQSVDRLAESGAASGEQAGYCVKQAYLGNRQAIG